MKDLIQVLGSINATLRKIAYRLEEIRAQHPSRGAGLMAGIRRFSKSSVLPIQIERFDISEHPVLSLGAATRSVEVRLNNQEVQILQGLSNIFQTSKQTAIRVAVHQLAGEPLGEPRKPGKRDSKRTKKVKLKLTEAEYKALQESADGTLLGEHIRHMVWHLSQGIKSGRITRVKGAKRKTDKQKLKEQAARSRVNPGSKLTALKKAQEIGLQEAMDKSEADMAELGFYVDNLRANGCISLVQGDDGRVDMDLARFKMNQ